MSVSMSCVQSPCRVSIEGNKDMYMMGEIYISYNHTSYHTLDLMGEDEQ